MSGDDRDLASLRRARAAQRASRDTDTDGAPTEPASDVDTGLTERIKEDPDLLLLFSKGDHNRQMIISAAKEAADRDLEIAGEKPPNERLSGMEKNLKFVHLVIVLIAIPVITSTFLVVRYVYGKGIENGTAQTSQQRILDDIADLKRDIVGMDKEISELHDQVIRLQQHQQDGGDLGRRHPAAVESGHGPPAATAPPKDPIP